MAGKMISQLTDAVTLQATDYIPLARGSTTLRTSGATLSANFLPKAGGTVTGPTAVTVTNNTTPALTITQAGTSYALRINDQSGTDPSPFAVDASGHLLVSCTTAKNGKELITTVPDTGFGLNSPFLATLSALSGDSGLYIKSEHGIPLYVEDGSGNDDSPFIIDKEGRVGIGTKTPNAKLTVVGDISAQGPISLSASTAEGVASLNITQAGNGLAVRVSDQATGDLSPFVIDANGKVGIGTSTPNEKLTVVGNISATGNLTVNSNVIATGASYPLYLLRSDVSNNNRWGMWLDELTPTTGKPLIIGPHNTSGTGNALLTLTRTSSSTNAIGNVGVGTATPNAELTVVGDVSATGSFISKNNFYLTANTTSIAGTPTGFFGSSILLAPNSKYELDYNLFVKNEAGTPKITYSLSGSQNFVNLNANFMQDLGGLSAVSTGTVVGKTGSLIDIGTTELFVPSASAYGLVRAMVTTGTFATSAVLTLSSSIPSAITPLAGSYRKVTLFS